MKGINDDDAALFRYSSMLKKINYSKLYINTPVRPPAEDGVFCIDEDRMKSASDILNGISIDRLVSTGFKSEIPDDLSAILSIIKRHPMNSFEITAFLRSRENEDPDGLIRILEGREDVASIDYKGFKTYRLK